MNDPLVQLDGFVVLYLEDGKPFIMDNAVHPTREAAGIAGHRLRKTFWVNAVTICLPRLAIQSPPIG